MNRRNRVALLAAFAIILAASGTVLALRAPGGSGEPAGVTQDEETPPTAEDLAHARDRLEANGLDASRLEELAAVYGIGGAVRLIAWSSDPDVGMSIDELRTMRDTGNVDGGPMGWGKMAKSLGVHPGLGSIMGNGGGHGRENAPGQAKKGATGDASGD
jgi:hypothetical protein